MTRRFSASVSMMFRELPLSERFAAAKRAGFQGVEIQVLAEGAPAAMAAAASAADVEVVLVNVGMGDFLTGGPGLSGVPGREDDFRAALAEARRAADLLNARFVHLGPSRVPAGVSRAACLEVYHANARFAAELFAGAASRLTLEPLNRVDQPTALFPDLASAEPTLAAFDGTLGLQFDLYHAAMNGEDLAACATRYAGRITHVQFADAPGRGPPGAGRTDFAVAFAALENAGYDGFFGAEYMPPQPTADTLGWLARLS